ncbi:hypothetical protein IFM89_010668 [Coptis chinensis]|uniref:Uncharacterized protein n=1 Tax=Coptis chinensis TaxID=261450 RepID=A0A835HDD6_9MAGN|nr:hypothetical protein IFM89_010668 [Coptis chinensis]
MNDIDFGGTIYAYLFRGMDEAVRTKSSRGQIVGFCIILQDKGTGKDRIEKHYGMVRHNIDLSHSQIEMATTNKIVWTPWSTACIMVRERDSFSEDGVDPTDDVWTARMVGSDGELVNYVIPHIDDSVLPQLDPHIEEHDVDTLRSMYALSLRLTHGMRRVLLDTSRQSFEDLQAERTRAAIAEHELEGIRLRFGQAYADSQAATQTHTKTQNTRTQRGNGSQAKRGRATRT